MRAKSESRWPRYVLVIPVLLIILLIFRVLYSSWGSSLPSCPIFSLTGKHCPGCGGTRAADALVHFRVLEALSFHAWFVVGVLLGLPVLFWMAVKERFPQWVGPKYHDRWLWFCLISLIVFAILRNMEAFSWFAP